MTAATFEEPIGHVRVQRWRSERMLRLLVILAAMGMWVAIAITVVGAVYALIIGVLFFFAHLGFVYHLRGNAVRLGPDQLPDLHRRIEEISRRVGLSVVPDAYLVQAGGALNALATKFLGRNFIVLFSDLVDACGENEDARDFIIAHELGHIDAGHLRWRWFLIPGLMIPFLGHAYSRACEYTSDRYGFAACGGRDSALAGLCVLAAGGRQGPNLNRRALVAQRNDLNTAWMTIGRWLSTHPPIAHRLAELEPNLAPQALSAGAARLGALAILAVLVIVPASLTAAFMSSLWPAIQKAMSASQGARERSNSPPADAPALRQQVERDILSLVHEVEAYRTRAGRLPSDLREVYTLWEGKHPGEPSPIDPYDGAPYGYRVEGDEYLIWSTGPDANDESDDLYYSSLQASK